MAIPILVLIELARENAKLIEAAGFQIRFAADAAERARLLTSAAPPCRAVLTNGSTGLTAAEMAALPNLEIVCAQGAGYEKIDLAAARGRGLVVTHGPGTNDASVADHAMALLFSIARGIPEADAAVRRGEWSRSRQPRPMIFGKRLGILGLGNIGGQIARRGAGGFDMAIAYHSRRRRDDAPYLYCPTPAALAEWSDFMVVATPGGAGTYHLVDQAVLAALGVGGFLINISRGSVVDTAALIDALHHRRIAGAALDVVEGEPDLPAGLAQLSNVILTPHIAGRSPEAVAATVRLVVENLSAHFAGQPVKTPVP